MKEMSLDESVTSFDLQRQKLFNQGQIYIVLSRMRNMEKMLLIENYNDVRRKDNLIAEIRKSTLSVTLLDTHSLRKHLDNIFLGKRLLYNNIIDLTGTLLEARENTVDLKVKLEQLSEGISTVMSKTQNYWYCLLKQNAVC